MRRLYSSLLRIIPIIIFISIAASFQSKSFAQSSASTEVTIIPGASTWFTISVPPDAVNPKLVGTYQATNGETIKVNVLKEEGCPTPLSAFDCVSIYSVSNMDHGSLDVSLESGKTYYLLFSNDAFLFPNKSVNVNYQLQTGGT